MISNRIVLRRASKDEAEKPFWISFSDLMTALMVLFLLVMSVALLAVTKNVSDVEEAEKQRNADIKLLLEKFQQVAKHHKGVTVDSNRNVIDFGDRAHFDTGQHRLNVTQARLLREFIPEALEVTRDPLADKWLKRIVVEGFADKRGSYLMNLNLSLQRSQRVLCVLLSAAPAGEVTLSSEDRSLVRELFLVGGYSFNSQKDSLDASRRIELRLEFLGRNETRVKPSSDEGEFGQCALGE